MSEVLLFILFLFLLLLTAGFFIFAMPGMAWSMHPFFFFLNKIQWYAHNPARVLFKDNRSDYPRIYYFVGFPLLVFWWVLMYFILFPIRVINSLYFNFFLFLSVQLRDSLADLIHPRAKGFRHLHGKKYLIRWGFDFPNRLLIMLFNQSRSIIQAVCMVIFDLIWPSLTLFHGTEFQSASVPISQSGQWKVGNEDFVGTGIYFALERKVAAHYAGTVKPSIIVARVSMSFVRPVSTLVKNVRTKAGFGGSGDMISKNAGWLTGALEHWRKDRGGWYEYCLVFPGLKGQYIRTWRIRPICVLPLDKRENKVGLPERIWKGMAFWPANKISWAVFGATFVLATLMTYLMAGPPDLLTWIMAGLLNK